MRDKDLATVLLVKAFEDEDRDARILPIADREAAAREAVRALGAEAPQERLLAARAHALFARLSARHPMIEGVRALTGGIAWIEIAAMLAGLAAGAALSALDGPRRIEIVLSLPLLGLLAWNLAVYLFIAYSALRRRGSAAGRGFLAATLARIPARLAARAVARWKAFDTGLAGALDRFVREWFALAAPVNRRRAVRAIHLAAAAIGLGLIAGVYLRGLALDYRAGWESTFLSAEQARSVVQALHGASGYVSGIALPSAAGLEAIRWPKGEPAARWMHLIALTVLLFVVVPRLLLAAGSAFAAWREASRMALPAALQDYFRSAFGSVGSVVPREMALVVPYAHAMNAAALARLIAWIRDDAGGRIDVEATEPLPYGEEERYLAGLAGRGAARASLLVLPFSLATTPEDENHGQVIEGVRDWIARERPGARLMVAIDEAPYRERMDGMAERVAERRELWRAFVEARGLKPRFLSLAQ